MDKNVTRIVLFLTLLACFMAWIGIILSFVPRWITQPTAIDVLMALGVGAVTQFFILLLKDGWQFYFRKKGPPTE